MTQHSVAETTIEKLTPDWIGVIMEVDTADGTRAGFRLGRYEVTTRDDERLWILFSTEPSWRIELRDDAKVRFAPPRASTSVSPSGYATPVGGPVTAPAGSAPRSPASWVTGSSS